MKNSFETTIQVTDPLGEIQEIDVCIEYEAEYEAEYITGLPENCYPATSSMELLEITNLDSLPDTVTKEMLLNTAENISDYLEELAWQDYMDREEDYDE